MKTNLIFKKVSAKGSDEFFLFPYYRFSANGNSMLIRRETGCTLFMSDDLADDIESGNISSELQYKLISRGFAKVDGVPDIRTQTTAIQPTFFLIDLTSRCNMNCSYCLRVPDEERDTISDEMLIKICEYIVNYCREKQISAISIQPWGGEPLLCINKIVKISEFFDEYRRNIRVNISVETNGTLLTEEKLKLLADHHIGLSFSLDGPPEIHDSQRMFANGKPSSSVIRDNMNLAAKYGYRDMGGICIITDHSIGRIEEILKYCEYSLNMKSIKLNLMRQPAYECNGVRALSENEIQEMVEEIVAALSRHRADGGQIRESNTEDRILNLTGNKNQNICNNSGCCGGKKMISFDRQGNLYPCELTDWKEECLGNIDNCSDLCKTIADAAVTHQYFKEKEDPLCRDCPWWYYCRGGCTSSIKYKRLSGSCIDRAECAFNRALYPLMTEKLLNNSADTRGWFI